MSGADTGGGQRELLTPPPKIFSIPRSRYSNRAVIVLEQCVVSYLRIFMYFISYKCLVDEVSSYCQLAVTFFRFFGLTLSNQRQCSASVHFDPPFHKSGSAPACIYQVSSILYSNISALNSFIA